MKTHVQSLIGLIFGLLTFTAHAMPNIIIEGSDGIGWPNISDNDLNPNQAVTDFDREFCNEQTERTYRIRNAGNQTLTVFVNSNSPSSSSSRFSFPDFPSGNFSIAAGSNRQFTIRFTPGADGLVQSTIRIDSNDPDSENIYTFAVEGEGRCGEVSAYYNPSNSSDVIINDGDTTPSTSQGTEFGSVSVGTTRIRDFCIRNSSTAPDVLRIRDPRITGSGAAHFQIASLGTSNLSTGGNRNFEIRFQPLSAGVKTATFTFNNNDSNENPYNFTLRGTGTAFPEISLQGKRDQFGTNFDFIADGQSVPNSNDGTLFDPTELGSSRDTIVRINNNGNATLTLQNRSITGSGAASFGTVGYSTASIAAGSSRDFRIRFTPVAAGTQTATFTFGNNDSDENPFNFTIRGIGQAPEIRISGRPVPSSGGYDNILDGASGISVSEGTDFGEVRVGSGHNDNEFKITNDGNLSLNISNARITGSGASHFSIRSLSTLTNILAGNDREFIIRFDPTSLGIKNATFIIDNNDADEDPYSFALRGVGTGLPEVRVQGTRPGEPLVEITDNTTSTRQAEGTLYANTEVGNNRTSNFRIHNDGDAPLTISSPTLTGAGATSFQVLNFSSGSLAPGAQEDFNVRFAPTSFGTKNATLAFTSNDGNENPFNFALSGTGEASEIQIAGHLPGEPFLNIDDGDTSPRAADGTDFGDTNVTGTGNEAQREFRITNSGNSKLNIQAGTTITGPAAGDYGISQLFAGNPFVDIGPNETQLFVITFDPSTTGVRNATVSIANNDPDEDPYTFALTGIGIGTPDLRVRGRRQGGLTFTEISDGDVTPRSNDGTLFADTDVDASNEMRVEVRNIGDGQLDFTSPPTITGPDADQFSIVSFNTSNMAPNEERIFNIRFSPDSFGTKNATVNLFSDSPGETTYNFAIRGLAEAPEMMVLGRGIASQFGEIVDGDTTPRAPDGTDFVTTGVGADESYQFRIDNTGNKDLIITSGSFVGDSENEFSVSGLNPVGNLTVKPGEPKFFDVTFEPENVGVELVTLVIENNDPDEDPYTFRMRGEGVGEPEIRVRGLTGTGIPFDIADGDLTPNQDVTQFGTVTLGQNQDRTFRIVNDGTDMLDISSITSSEPEFTFIGLDTTIEPGEIDNFTIRFAPSDTEELETIITIRSNDPTSGDPYTFALVGSGEGPEMSVRGGGSTFSITIADGDTSPRSADGTLFGEVNPNGGSLVVPFRILNRGNDTLTINDKSVTGTHASDFTIRGLPTSPLNTNIGANGFTDFEIEFNPSAAGTRNATIVLNSNDADENPYTFAVRGVGQDPGLQPEIRVAANGSGALIADGDMSPSPADGTDLGGLTLGGSTALATFIVHNDGDADLEIYGVTVNNALYTNTTPATVAPGQQRPFNVTFNPDEVGVQAGTVTIFCNDTTNSSYRFALTAEVVAAEGELAITDFSIDGNDASVTFTSRLGETYSIKKSTTLGSGNWTTVPGYGDIAGSASPQTIDLMNAINPTTDPKAFFRLEKNP